MTASRAFALLIGLVLLPTIALAQTSGNLTTQMPQNWSTAPWVITSGPGTYPDAGGVATWGTVTNTTIGSVAAGTTVTLDVPVSLSGLTLNSPFSLALAASGVNTLDLTTNGATFNVTLSVVNTPTLISLAHTLSAPLSGGGTAGVTKMGPGTMTLASATGSTYTGGTHINGGGLFISGAGGDAVLGATGPGNGISIDGGTLQTNITGGWTTSRDIALGAGGGTIQMFTAATVNGVVSGAGNLTAGNNTLTLGGINTYSGTSTFNTGGGGITLSGNGSIASSSRYDFSGTINLDNSATNVSNRLSGTAGMTLRGAILTLTGNATAATNEIVGAVTLAGGSNVVTITPNTAQPAGIAVANLTRQGAAGLFVRGTSLGSAAGANVAQLTSAVAPTLVGGGGADGSTTISIVPWIAGNTSATAVLGSSLVTFSATTGFRPLATSEYAAAFGGNATDNVRLTTDTVAPAATANAVLFAPAVAANLSGGTIAVTSGAVLYSPTATATGTISANLAFGTAEGVLTTSNMLVVNGAIGGSGGLTINPFNGSSVTISGANTYTGPTTLVAGSTLFAGTITNDGTASPFGAGTSAVSPIVFNPGRSSPGLLATAASVINRDIIVLSTGPGLANLGTSADGFTLTVNGSVTVNGSAQLLLNAGTTLAAAAIMNGDISGTGSLRDNGTACILNGNNTYSGGTNILAGGIWAAGSNTAFGTGTIYFSGAGTIQTADTTARTLGNNLLFLANPTFGGAGNLTFSGSVNLNGSRTFTVTNTSAAGVAFTGVVSNGSLTKAGTGLLALNSTTGNTYTGGTVLAAGAGTLSVNNASGSGTGTGTVSIGGTTAVDRSALTGNFTISGATSISGALNPGGATVGTANFGSSLTMTSNALVSMKISGATTADKVAVGGLFTFGGSTITVTTTGGYQAVLGNAFTLFTWGSVNSSAAPTLDLSAAILADAVNTQWDTSTFTTNGVIRVVPVPEPAFVFLVGSIGWGVARRWVANTAKFAA
jgi:autotransporter-associated beta strand protein